MPLDPSQYAAVKAAIAADPVLAALPNTPDGNFEIARLLNLNATPDWTVWKTNVAIGEVGKAINGTELAGLTTANLSRLQTIALYETAGVNPSLPDQRQFFDDVFSGAGGNITRPKLATLWKRLARRIEKILSTGTGSVAAPATLAFEGEISYAEVQAARSA